jgi:hypothetical protein
MERATSQNVNNSSKTRFIIIEYERQLSGNVINRNWEQLKNYRRS